MNKHMILEAARAIWPRAIVTVVIDSRVIGGWRINIEAVGNRTERVTLDELQRLSTALQTTLIDIEGRYVDGDTNIALLIRWS